VPMIGEEKMEREKRRSPDEEMRRVER